MRAAWLDLDDALRQPSPPMQAEKPMALATVATVVELMMTRETR
jgi:hypothetical protein